ncbi:MAG: right-handed parallel beta-helix repeat-containing protein, partial [Candidatus Zixiibacteriota bacterium]
MPFFSKLLAKTDSLVDFNPFDLVSGMYMTFEPSVDILIFVMIGVDVPNWAVARGLNAYFDRPGRKLADVNSHGDSLLAYNFITYAFNPDTASVYTHAGLLVHEFGHCFGWPDTYYNNHSALGSFCGMGLRTFRDLQPSPYNPVWLIRMGWLEANEIEYAQDNYLIPDIFESSNVVKLGLPGGQLKQHFLATYHNLTTARFWENNWPKKGLMIWHVDESLRWTGGDNSTSWFNKFEKPIDIEYASGLFYQQSDSTLLQVARPNSGADSLDLRTGVWLNEIGWGSGSALWHSGTKTTFDENSNPNSNFYYTVHGKDPLTPRESTLYLFPDPRDSVYQDLKTGIAVKNIVVNSGGGYALADLYPGRCGMELAASTTLSGTVMLPNGLIIPPGVTVTLDPGTTLQISPSRDWCQQVSDTKNAIIVEGALVIQGTQSQPVQIHSSAGQPGFDDWEGIVVKSGGTATVSYAEIKHARTAISFDNVSASSVMHCLIDSCKLHGIKSVNPQLRIEHNRIYRVNSGYGVHLRDSCTVLNNTFGEPEFSCRFSPVGLRAEYSNALIDSNTFWFRTSAYPPCGITNIAAIEVQGKKSQSQPLVIRRCFIDGYDVGIDIAMKSNVLIELCDLFRVPSITPSHIGINDRGNMSNVVVRNTFIVGYNTGVHSKSGEIDLGVWDGYHGGGNSIFMNCGHDYQGRALCDVDEEYRFVTTNAIDGTIMAEGNRWVFPCSTSTCPDPDKVPDILDSSPCGGFDYAWCGYPSDKRTSVTEPATLPLEFDLAQNFPNPFNPQTTIGYSLARPMQVELSVFNLLGQKVASLHDGPQTAGFHEVTWDGRDNDGFEVSSGVY